MNNNFELFLIVYLLSIFSLSAMLGTKSYYTVGDRLMKGEFAEIHRRKNGVVTIKLHWIILTMSYFFVLLGSWIMGGMAFWIIEQLIALNNTIFKTRITIDELYYTGGYPINIFCGACIYCGYYFGKAYTCHFLATQILINMQDKSPLGHPNRNISVAEVLEENMRRREARETR